MAGEVDAEALQLLSGHAGIFFAGLNTVADENDRRSGLFKFQILCRLDDGGGEQCLALGFQFGHRLQNDGCAVGLRRDEQLNVRTIAFFAVTISDEAEFHPRIDRTDDVTHGLFGDVDLHTAGYLAVHAAGGVEDDDNP